MVTFSSGGGSSSVDRRVLSVVGVDPFLLCPITGAEDDGGVRGLILVQLSVREGACLGIAASCSVWTVVCSCPLR